MIVQSKLECVHQYGEVNLVPGVNLIPDNVGRELVKHRGWQELLASKHQSIAGKVKILVQPAPETKKGAVSEKGEAATANLSADDAIKFVNQSDVVDQIQQIMLLDTRPKVQNAAQTRLDTLAKLALKEGEEGDEATNLADGALPPDFKDDEQV